MHLDAEAGLRAEAMWLEGLAALPAVCSPFGGHLQPGRALAPAVVKILTLNRLDSQRDPVEVSLPGPFLGLINN